MQPSAARPFLTFLLSGNELAIPLAEVAQIVDHVQPTRLPHLPEAIRGVINLRGEVVPVVDLALKLGLSSQPVTRRTCIIVVETREAGLLGVIADAARQIVELADSDVLPTPTFGVPVRADYLVGLGKAGDRLLLLVDSPKALSPAELLAAASVHAP